MILVFMGKQGYTEKIAHRIRALVEDVFREENITVSAGIAVYDPEKNILKRLEEAMLMAKTAGKNRVYLIN